jgi:hypothetical protein
LLEEAIQRALLPAWAEVSRSIDDQSESLVQGLQATGWRKSCADQLVEYAHKFTGSRRDKRHDDEQKPTWYS